MKINVGDYVGTRYGIRKITKIEDEDVYIIDKSYINDFKQEVYGITDNCIIGEPSPNIIDLVEIGDFITLGENCYPLQVRNIWEHAGELNVELSNSAKFEDIKNDNDFRIYSIITREQIEQGSYKVGKQND